MNETNGSNWKAIAGICALAAAAIGALWWLTSGDKVDQQVADSLRVENAELATTVESLRAAPPETVYAELPADEASVGDLAEVIGDRVDALAAVLPDNHHPVYWRRVEAVRAAVDSLPE